MAGSSLLGAAGQACCAVLTQHQDRLSSGLSSGPSGAPLCSISIGAADAEYEDYTAFARSVLES